MISALNKAIADKERELVKLRGDRSVIAVSFSEGAGYPLTVFNITEIEDSGDYITLEPKEQSPEDERN